MRRTTTAVITTVLLLSACGGDDGGSASGGDFCDQVEGVDRSMDAVFGDSVDFEDPDALEEAFTEAVDQLNSIADAAPSEIEDDMNTMVEGIEAFAQVMRDNDWDFFAVMSDEEAAATLEELDSDEYQEASDNVADYIRDECGIDIDATGDSSGDSSGDSGDDSSDDGSAATIPGSDISIPLGGTEVEQVAAIYQQIFGLDEDQATCLAEKLIDAGGNTDDPTAVLDFLEDCDISLEDISG